MFLFHLLYILTHLGRDKMSFLWLFLVLICLYFMLLLSSKPSNSPLQARYGAWRPGESLCWRDQYGQHHGTTGPSSFPPLSLVPLQQAGAQSIHPVCCVHLGQCFLIFCQHHIGLERYCTACVWKWFRCYCLYFRTIPYLFSTLMTLLLSSLSSSAPMTASWMIPLSTSGQSFPSFLE